MKKTKLDLDTLAVETFTAGGQQARDLASISRWCTLYDTCTNCNDDTCIC